MMKKNGQGADSSKKSPSPITSNCDHDSPSYTPTPGKDPFSNNNFQEVGCLKCGRGGSWRIFTDGKDHFKAQCNYCGNISNFEIKTGPDSLVIPPGPDSLVIPLLVIPLNLLT